MATGLPGDTITLTATPVANCGCCTGADACRCKTRDGNGNVLTDIAVPKILCCTLTGFNRCRFKANPEPPSLQSPHELFGMNTTRLTGIKLRMQRTAPDPDGRCQVWGITPPSPLGAVSDCGANNPPLNNYSLSCSGQGNSFGVPCGSDISLANDVGGGMNHLGQFVNNWLWASIQIQGHCCEFTNPDPPLANRRTIIYCPWVKGSREQQAGNTVYGRMTGLTCSPFSFTMNYYLTGVSVIVGGSEAGGMPCDYPPDDPLYPPECNQLILSAYFSEGECLLDEGGGDDPVDDPMMLAARQMETNMMNMISKAGPLGVARPLLDALGPLSLVAQVLGKLTKDKKVKTKKVLGAEVYVSTGVKATPAKKDCGCGGSKDIRRALGG